MLSNKDKTNTNFNDDKVNESQYNESFDISGLSEFDNQIERDNKPFISNKNISEKSNNESGNLSGDENDYSYDFEDQDALKEETINTKPEYKEEISTKEEPIHNVETVPINTAPAPRSSIDAIRDRWFNQNIANVITSVKLESNEIDKQNNETDDHIKKDDEEIIKPESKDSSDTHSDAKLEFDYKEEKWSNEEKETKFNDNFAYAKNEDEFNDDAKIVNNEAKHDKVISFDNFSTNEDFNETFEDNKRPNDVSALVRFDNNSIDNTADYADYDEQDEAEIRNNDDDVENDHVDANNETFDVSQDDDKEVVNDESNIHDTLDQEKDFHNDSEEVEMEAVNDDYYNHIDDSDQSLKRQHYFNGYDAIPPPSDNEFASKFTVFYDPNAKDPQVLNKNNKNIEPETIKANVEVVLDNKPKVKNGNIENISAVEIDPAFYGYDSKLRYIGNNTNSKTQNKTKTVLMDDEPEIVIIPNKPSNETKNKHPNWPIEIPAVPPTIDELKSHLTILRSTQRKAKKAETVDQSSAVNNKNDISINKQKSIIGKEKLAKVNLKLSKLQSSNLLPKPKFEEPSKVNNALSPKRSSHQTNTQLTPTSKSRRQSALKDPESIRSPENTQRLNKKMNDLENQMKALKKPNNELQIQLSKKKMFQSKNDSLNNTFDDDIYDNTAAEIINNVVSESSQLTKRELMLNEREKMLKIQTNLFEMAKKDHFDQIRLSQEFNSHSNRSNQNGNHNFSDNVKPEESINKKSIKSLEFPSEVQNDVDDHIIVNFNNKANNYNKLKVNETCRDVVDPMRISKQELEWKVREQKLITEIDSLKSKIIAIQNFESENPINHKQNNEIIVHETANIINENANPNKTDYQSNTANSKPKNWEETPIVVNKVKPADIKYIKKEYKPENLSGKTVTIPIEEYDDMMKDLNMFEVMIHGFQVENERLVAAAKQKEIDNNFKFSKFYDKQEALNIELNNYRNMLGIIPSDNDRVNTENKTLYASNVGNEEDDNQIDIMNKFGNIGISLRRSSQLLQKELDYDSTIRNLKDKFFEEKKEYVSNIKEMQLTIEKLRKENKDLASSLTNMPFNNNNLLLLENEKFNLEKKKLTEEVLLLRNKLQWFAENQELIDDANSEKIELKKTINELKSQLKNKHQLLQYEDNNDLENSLISTMNKTNNKSIRRDPADIKKIKYYYYL